MNELINEILADYDKIWSIRQAQSLMGWDLETYMPEAAAKRRGDAYARLSLMEQEAYLPLKEKVKRAQEKHDLSDPERGILRVLNRRIHYFTAIPPELLARQDRTSAEAAIVWRKARKVSDFSIFKPYLEQIVEIQREIAEKLGYKNHPYNALIDQYEEGFTTDDADAVFSFLLPASKEIFDKVSQRAYFSGEHELESKKYDTKKMYQVNSEIVDLLLMPKDRFRMDISTHPFTIGISPNDVRITTRYEGVNFKASLYSTIHESGHAIYDLQIPEDISTTPVWGGASTGIHESQSRFWENFVGRSRMFTELVTPILKRHLKFLSKYTSDELYRYFNKVNPTMIRVDADEVTYNFHIAVRYEIEKQLISGKMSVSDSPEAWNDLMDKYIGIRPKNYSEGILQDIHWSQGGFGYFPTYTLGNVVAGMVWDSGNYKQMIRDNDFAGIKGSLYQKIHKFGSIYSPKDLLFRTFGETYNPSHLIRYLREKYVNEN
jgi:carboxypeptidase Taq